MSSETQKITKENLNLSLKCKSVGQKSFFKDKIKTIYEKEGKTATLHFIMYHISLQKLRTKTRVQGEVSYCGGRTLLIERQMLPPIRSNH